MLIKVHKTTAKAKDKGDSPRAVKARILNSSPYAVSVEQISQPKKLQSGMPMNLDTRRRVERLRQ